MCSLLDVIQSIFPRAAYENYAATKQDNLNILTPVKGYVLHYLIALEQPVSTVISRINVLAAKNSKELNSQIPHCRWAPLHLAVLMNREEIVRALLENGATADTQDASGWTPLHHAAASANHVMETLLVKTNTHLQTHFGATPQDLKRVFGFDDPLSSYDSVKCQGAKVSLGEFLHATSFQRYRDLPLISTEKMGTYWYKHQKKISPDIAESLFYPIFKKFYDKNDRPCLEVKKDDAMVEKPWGLFAGENILSGRVVAEYAGQVTYNGLGASIDEIAYQFEEVVALSVGNISRFANDGFPNSEIFRVRNTLGFETLPFLVSLTDIPEGEEILFDYTTMIQLKWGFYRVKKKDQIRAYYAPGPTKLYQDLLQARKKFEKTLAPADFARHNLLADRFTYALTTPLVVILLDLENIVEAKSWTSYLYDNVTKIYQEDEVGILHFKMMAKLITLLETLRSTLNHPNVEKQKQTILDFLMSASQELTLFQLSTAISRLPNMIQKGQHQLGDLARLQQDLSKTPWDQGYSLLDSK